MPWKSSNEKRHPDIQSACSISLFDNATVCIVVMVIRVVKFSSGGQTYTECPTQMGTTSDPIFYFLKHICQKVRPVLKFLWKKLSDGTLKPRKFKLEVFLNWLSKKSVKFKKPLAPNHHLPLIFNLAPNHHLPLIFSSLYIVKLPFLHSFLEFDTFFLNSI